MISRSWFWCCYKIFLYITVPSPLAMKLKLLFTSLMLVISYVSFSQQPVSGREIQLNIQEIERTVSDAETSGNALFSMDLRLSSDAGKKVELQPGFKAENTVFTAKIGGCN